MKSVRIFYAIQMSWLENSNVVYVKDAHKGKVCSSYDDAEKFEDINLAEDAARIAFKQIAKRERTASLSSSQLWSERLLRSLIHTHCEVCMKHIESLPEQVWDEIKENLKAYKSLPFSSKSRRKIEQMCEQALSSYCASHDSSNDGVAYETGSDTFKIVPFREIRKKEKNR